MDHLSSSQISLYLQCSLKYKFHYVDRIPKPFKSSGLAFGSVVHSALSWFHKEILKGNNVTLDSFYRIFDADWYVQKIDENIRYKDGESEMKLVVMAKDMLSQYFHAPRNKIKGTEVPFVIPLVNPSSGKSLDINLEGFFDLIEDNDVITEFKTSNQTMNQSDVDDHIQLTAYGYAYEMIHRRSPKAFKIVNFVKNKKPKMAMFETTREKSDYQRFFNLASQVLRGIRGHVFFPRQSFICRDCEYIPQCRAWGVQKMSA